MSPRLLKRAAVNQHQQTSRNALSPLMPFPSLGEAGSLSEEALRQQGAGLLRGEDCLALGCAVQAASLKSLPC